MIGRFISADSLVPNWYNPQTLNRYGYCSNNPLKYVDPNGDTAWDIIDVISFVDSAVTFANNPTLENAAWLAGDIIGLAPGIPGTGTVKAAIKGGKKILNNVKKVENATAAGKKLDKAGDAAGAANKGGVCFVAGTLVHTENGLVPIEKIEADDIVLSRDEITGEIAYQKVLRTFVTPDTPILELKIEDENGQIRTFKTTAEHPFWVNGKEWVRAEKLLPGDEVFTSSGGWIKVSGGTWLQVRQTVYNFEVDEFHTYFVGECGVWVHNNPCAKGPVKENDISSYKDFKDNSVVGDNLEGHEAWQHANLNENGLAKKRLSTSASKNNPVIALDKKIHKEVNRAQRSLKPRTQTPLENIQSNIDILRKNPNVPDDAIDILEKEALEHAKNLDVL